MNDVFKDVTNFLYDIAKLWKRHKKRDCESKKLILKALEKNYEKNEPHFQVLKSRELRTNFYKK